MITALGPRLGLGLRLDFGSQVWFVQYFSEKKVIVLYDAPQPDPVRFRKLVTLLTTIVASSRSPRRDLGRTQELVLRNKRAHISQKARLRPSF